MAATEKALIVVPCYNEAKRLHMPAWLEAMDKHSFDLLFVDDGSTDSTAQRIDEISASRPEQTSSLKLATNQGKGEAVRQGLLAGLACDYTYLGFADADLATPIEELARLYHSAVERDVPIVLGSRWLHMGASIERTGLRHYLGRVFATSASLILKMPIYDTQCGAKFFKNGPALVHALSEPFHSAWAFDVELLGRLLSGPHGLPSDALLEVPLRAWHDVPGTKLSTLSSARTFLELTRINRALKKWRAK